MKVSWIEVCIELDPGEPMPVELEESVDLKIRGSTHGAVVFMGAVIDRIVQHTKSEGGGAILQMRLNPEKREVSH